MSLTPIQIANHYFELSNKSDFAGIAQLLTPTTHYESENTGSFVGADAIIAMQKEFHAKFTELYWSVNSIQVVDRATFCFDYNFNATTQDGERIENTGLEYLTIADDKITAINIKSKVYEEE